MATVWLSERQEVMVNESGAEEKFSSEVVNLTVTVYSVAYTCNTFGSAIVRGYAPPIVYSAFMAPSHIISPEMTTEVTITWF